MVAKKLFSSVMIGLVVAACEKGPTNPPIEKNHSAVIVMDAVVNPSAPPQTPVAVRAVLTENGKDVTAQYTQVWYVNGQEVGSGNSPLVLPEGTSRVEVRFKDTSGKVVATASKDVLNPRNSDVTQVGINVSCQPIIYRGENLPPTCLSAKIVKNDRNYQIAFSWKLSNSNPVSNPGELPFASLQVGTHSVVLTGTVAAQNLTVNAQTSVSVREVPSVTGKVWGLTPQGYTIVPGVRVSVIKDGLSADSVTSSNGSFSLQSLNLLGDTIVIKIADSAGLYHPAEVRVPSTKLADEIRLVLVPFRWTVAKGTYAGQTADISMKLAFEPASDGLSFYYENNLSSWNPDKLPVAVAVDSAASNREWTPAVFSDMWFNLNHMMDAHGVQYFKPGALDQANQLGIRAWFDSTDFSRGGPSEITDGWITKGIIHFSSYTATNRGNRTTEHEFTHVLNVGHTCSWLSVVASVGCFGSFSATLWDVAYIHLRDKMREVQAQLNAPHGLLAALAGQQRYGQ